MENFHQNINSITKELRKDSISVKNRLQSILHDAKFVDTIKVKWDFPLIPNERCGLWYVPTWEQIDSSYFKSTDGHTNVWTFSMRRLNLHLLPLIGKNGGIVIIDSTRKGKLMPDALLKTIPIWCAVLNTVLFDGLSEQDIAKELNVTDYKNDEEFQFLMTIRANNWLYTPKNFIPESEAHHISILIKDLAEKALQLKVFSKQKLIRDLGVVKPLIPEWYYPSKKLQKTEDFFEFETKDKHKAYFSIVCLTASKKVKSPDDSQITVRYPNKSVSWTYIQGSADDHELWATKDICNGKFDSIFFWNHVYHSKGELNNKVIDEETGYFHDWMSDEELIKEINAIYNTNNRVKLASLKINLDLNEVKNSINDTNILIGTIDQNLDFNAFTDAYPDIKQVIIFSETFAFQNTPDEKKIQIYQYKVGADKKGAKKLREIFPSLVPQLSLKEKLLILCENGKDISAGLTLLLLCGFFNLSWELQTHKNTVNKDLIKLQLSLLNEVRKVNPSRNTLQSINSYLM